MTGAGSGWVLFGMLLFSVIRLVLAGYLMFRSDAEPPSSPEPPAPEPERPRCRHPRTIVVESSVTGEPLARLCTTCDQPV